MMREFRPDWTEYGISKQRYVELKGFCRQYPEWKSEASSLIGIGAQNYGERVMSSDHTSTVVRIAERREELINKILLIESVAMAIDGGEWFAALIQNVCLGKPLSCIDPLIMPTSRRNEYYTARRKFFILLNSNHKVDTPGAPNP